MDLDYNGCVHGRLDSCLVNSHYLSFSLMGGVFSLPLWCWTCLCTCLGQWHDTNRALVCTYVVGLVFSSCASEFVLRRAFAGWAASPRRMKDTWKRQNWTHTLEPSQPRSPNPHNLQSAEGPSQLIHRPVAWSKATAVNSRCMLLSIWVILPWSRNWPICYFSNYLYNTLIIFLPSKFSFQYPEYWTHLLKIKLSDSIPSSSKIINSSPLAVE